ncbi:MAG: metallophosphoesterase [Planctomycetota bacterium]|jgi:3',5'-cyclic AMP phosphodiesterase CpdA
MVKAFLALILTICYGHLSCAQETGAKPFTFAQICDTQLGFGGYDQDVRSFRQAVKQINSLQPDFAVICGDLVNQPDDQSFADFLRIRNTFTVPCYAAPGNHDVTNQPTPASLKRYRDRLGKDYYVVEHKGYTFVVVNTQLWKAPLEIESEKHHEWVVQSLKTAKAKNSPVFVVGHHPLYVKEPLEEEAYYNLPLETRGELLALYEESGVVAVLAGHTHKKVINNYQGIQLVNGETTSKNFDRRPFGFRLWTIASPQSIRHEFVPLDLSP